MPLKLTRRPGTKVWQVTGTLAGQRVRQSTGTADRRLADQIRADLEARVVSGTLRGAKSVTTWDEACTSYLDLDERSAAEQRRLLRLTQRLTGRLLADIDQVAVDDLIKALGKTRVAPATKLREVITPLKAVLSHAAVRGWCDAPKFETPKGATGVKRTRWLTPDEAQRLIEAASTHHRPLVVFLLGTGARLGEALALEWRSVDLAHGRALLRYDTTKAGVERWADLPPAVVAALANMPAEKKRGAVRVFRPPVVKRFGQMVQADAYRDTEGLGGGQVKTAWAAMCRRAKVEDCSPHTCRHTWASWRYALHRDLLRLQFEGGWSNVSLVQRYAKLVPATMLPGIRKVLGLRDADTPPTIDLSLSATTR